MDIHISNMNFDNTFPVIDLHNSIMHLHDLIMNFHHAIMQLHIYKWVRRSSYMDLWRSKIRYMELNNPIMEIRQSVIEIHGLDMSYYGVPLLNYGDPSLIIALKRPVW